MKSRHALLVIITLSLFLVPVTTRAEVVQDQIVLSEGTAVKVVTTAEITSKNAKPNDPVGFTVVEDVVINGQVVVRTGTEAIGSVVNAEKGGYMGKSGKLAIQVESTKTVDGQSLKLRAAKGKEGEDNQTSTMVLSFISPVFLFKKGGEAKVEPGTPITVYVAQEKRFRVEGSELVAIAIDPATGATSTADAIVFIYRPKKIVGSALEPSVFVDETELARMDNGRYFAIKVKPGKHIIRLTNDKKGYALDMGPGQKYFFRIGIEAGMWKGQGKITLDDAERAITEIKKLKFLDQEKIKATTLVVELPPN
ncbi:MAG TPA: DUF2846 domain-containing protein [Pyrinomonadaceae bacterium]|nr:DUF2846 domain-containing protein [Pyrinomonadaceae bacterium]